MVSNPGLIRVWLSALLLLVVRGLESWLSTLLLLVALGVESRPDPRLALDFALARGSRPRILA